MLNGQFYSLFPILCLSTQVVILLALEHPAKQLADGRVIIGDEYGLDHNEKECRGTLGQPIVNTAFVVRPSSGAPDPMSHRVVRRAERLQGERTDRKNSGDLRTKCVRIDGQLTVQLAYALFHAPNAHANHL